MTTSKNNKTFTWNVRAIDIERGGKYAAVPSIIAHLDILGAPGSTASMIDLHVDLQNRLSGVPASIPEIKKVIFNPPCTIVLWSDNTKTIVRCQEGDEYDPEKGLAMAIVKKMYGNTGKYCEIFKKWVPDVEYIYPEIPSISYEEALEKIKKVAEASTMSMNEALNSLYGKRRNELAEKKEAKARAEKLEKETGWIATTHKLPGENGDYLAYDLFTGSTYVYEYDKNNISDVIYFQRNVSHWMPVPAAPVTKKGE